MTTQYKANPDLSRHDFDLSSFSFVSSDVVIDVHHHYCYQLAIAIDKPFDCLIGGNTLGQTWGFLANQNVVHSRDASDSQLLVSFVDTESLLGQTLKNMLDGNDYIEIESILGKAPLKNVIPADHKKLSDTELRKHINKFFCDFFLKYMPVDPILTDVRIQKTLRFIEDNLKEKIKVKNVAENLFLSPDRARHYFTEQTGLPLSRFVIWKRIRKISEAVILTKISVTEACQLYGFVDYSHFSRTFKGMFGIKPKCLFNDCRVIL